MGILLLNDITHHFQSELMQYRRVLLATTSCLRNL